MGWVVNATSRPLCPRERPGTHCIGDWVVPRDGLDRCGKSRPHRNSIPGPSIPYQIAIPTELSRPTKEYNINYKFNTQITYQINVNQILVSTSCISNSLHVISNSQLTLKSPGGVLYVPDYRA